MMQSITSAWLVLRRWPMPSGAQQRKVDRRILRSDLQRWTPNAEREGYFVCSRVLAVVVILSVCRIDVVQAQSDERLATDVNDNSEPDNRERELTAWLCSRDLSDAELQSLSELPESSKPLTKDEAADAVKALWVARLEFLRKDRKAETDARELVIGELKMPFWYKVFGDAPAGGRSLFISMHGGGGAPQEVNDRQYENQKELYEPAEGVYLVPRAATNTWDLWHQSHIDQFFNRLITNMIVFENVNPNRVYLMGYSAGGDGVYQLAPRMADRLAAAAMMAGHPNESRPEGLRNIGFALHMGALDSAYNRNSVAKEWGIRLDDLQAADPGGYVHEVVLHEGRGHWMNREDAVAVPWMAKFDRNPWPKKIVWVQDDVIHSRFYWLRLDVEAPGSPNTSDSAVTAFAKAGDEITASTDGNTIRIEKCSARRIKLLLSDDLVNIDEPVTVILPDGTQTTHHPVRTLATIAESLQDRNDPVAVPSATITVDVSTDL